MLQNEIRLWKCVVFEGKGDIEQPVFVEVEHDHRRDAAVAVQTASLQRKQRLGGPLCAVFAGHFLEKHDFLSVLRDGKTEEVY